MFNCFCQRSICEPLIYPTTQLGTKAEEEPCQCQRWETGVAWRHHSRGPALVSLACPSVLCPPPASPAYLCTIVLWGNKDKAPFNIQEPLVLPKAHSSLFKHQQYSNIARALIAIGGTHIAAAAWLPAKLLGTYNQFGCEAQYQTSITLSISTARSSVGRRIWCCGTKPVTRLSTTTTLCWSFRRPAAFVDV